VTVRVRPITDGDLTVVGEFLHAHLNPRVTAAAWASATDVPWAVDAPNHGFFLVDDARDDAVVGAHLAFYSTRDINGQTERFCNLGAWCVLPDHRIHGLRLLKALLAQPDLHFTDLSPSGNVVEINTRLKFQFLDTTTALVPNLPWPTVPGRGTVTADPKAIEAALEGEDRKRYRDHANLPAARHVLLVRDGRPCWVMFRKDRRKGLPVFASILHVSDPEVLRVMARPFGRHLLVHHGALATLAELEVVKHRPRPSVLLESPRRKMYRSSRLGPKEIDYLYSELVCVAW
jgi:hypothetical protein